MRALIFLIIVLAVIVLIRSLFRSASRRTTSKRPPVVIDATADELPPPPSELPAASGALTAAEVFKKLYELALGTSGLQLADLAREDPIVKAAQAAFETAATEPRYAPRRPMLLPQLLRAVNDSEVSRREISTIIGRDPALAGNLLKLANSSFYRVNAQPVESVDRAVALLGTEGIRSLIAAALVQPVFRAAAGAFSEFADMAWEHTVRSASAAESHAAVVENTDPFAAQLLGLVMGLAMLVIFRVTLDQYQAQGARPDPAVIAALLDQHVAEVARRIAASWDLSDRILSALDDQAPAVANESTALGRSLRFGRLLGALAVLNSKNVLDDEMAKAAMLAAGASEPQFDRFWTRLTGRPSASERGQHRPPSSLTG